jgi:hypothetical protein
MTNRKTPRVSRASIPATAALVAPSKSAPKSRPKAATPPVADPSPASIAKPKQKLVRDSFTIPKSEYLVLEALKLRAATLARPAKKSEVLRAGIGALNAMGDKAFLAALGRVPSLKTGRPKNPLPEEP